MKTLRILLFIGLMSVGSHTAFGQVDASSLIGKLLENSKAVRSFEADVDIQVDVDFIRIPVKKGRVFYKAPDKFKFRATGFVLVPKKGLNFTFNEMLSSEHAAIYAGADSLNHIVKIVPLGEDADFALATAWIDKMRSRVNRLDVTTKGQGNYSLYFEYGNLSFDLPVSTRVHFEIGQIDIPMKFIGSLKVDKKKAGERSSGNVTLRYSNFIINRQIADAIFTENDNIR